MLDRDKLYSTLRDLTFPDKPATKTFEELVTLLKTSSNTWKIRFYKRDQKEGESMQEYVAQLRKMSLHCGFNADLKEK